MAKVKNKTDHITLLPQNLTHKRVHVELAPLPACIRVGCQQTQHQKRLCSDCLTELKSFTNDVSLLPKEDDDGVGIERQPFK